MEIIKDNCIEKTKIFICEWCNSKLKLTLKDIHDSRRYDWPSNDVDDINLHYYICPCCDRVNVIELKNVHF